MTTYSDTVYSALLTADEPMSSRALYKAHDTFESAEQVNKAVAYLVKQGRAEMVGMEKPKGGKAVRLYRALTPDDQTERAPSAPADLDQQLAAAIRERDAELAEAVIEPEPPAEPAAEPAASIDDDPVIREIARYREPAIQDGDRLARHLIAGADVLQDRLPALAGSMREAADALREFAA